MQPRPTAHESLADFVDSLAKATDEGRVARANGGEGALLAIASSAAYPALAQRTEWQAPSVRDLLDRGRNNLGGRAPNAGSDVDSCVFFDIAYGKSQHSLAEHCTLTAQLFISCLDECTGGGCGATVSRAIRVD